MMRTIKVSIPRMECTHKEFHTMQAKLRDLLIGMGFGITSRGLISYNVLILLYGARKTAKWWNKCPHRYGEDRCWKQCYLEATK